MAKVIAYLRVSTDEQVNSGLGLDIQLEAITADQGAPDAVYRDDGVSGSRADRPGLLDALDALEPGDVLAVAKRDRLARDMYVSCWIEKEVKVRQARIISAAGEGNGDELSDLILRRVSDMFAEIERHTINARLAAGRTQARKKGRKLGGDVPFGYGLSADGRHLTVNEAEQRVLRLVKALRAEGESLREIGAELERRGVLSKKGHAKWHPQTIKQLLEQQVDLAAVQAREAA